MSSINKNQSAAERARAKAQIADDLTRHSCFTCQAQITIGTLFPVKVSQQGMRFYHKDCAKTENLT